MINKDKSIKVVKKAERIKEKQYKAAVRRIYKICNRDIKKAAKQGSLGANFIFNNIKKEDANHIENYYRSLGFDVTGNLVEKVYRLFIRWSEK